MLLTTTPAAAQLDRLLKGLPQIPAPGGVSDVKIRASLKEALQVGTENAVYLTGKTDGFFLNQATVPKTSSSSWKPYCRSRCSA